MFYNNSSYPLTLYGGNISRSRLGNNWKMFNGQDSYIIDTTAPTIRPPAHNNVSNETNNTLLISGSNANNFRSRPLKHWRKQRSGNPESLGVNKFNKPKQSNSRDKSLINQINVPGGTTNTKLNCVSQKNVCDSEALVPPYKVAIRENNNIGNKIGQFNPLNEKEKCNIICDNKVIGKASVCDPQSKAINRVLYPSSVNNNPNKINTPTYYQVNNNYLRSRCLSYPDSFVKKGDKGSKITILDCENDEPNGKYFTKKCNSTKIYKNSNQQFLKNSSVKSSTGLLRKKYNTLRASNFYNTGLNSAPYDLQNGHGLSNFDNQVGSSICTAARREVPFLFKTRPLDNDHRYGGGAKINPVKCEPGLYRKSGNFTTSCMNNNFGKTIMHMQLDIKTKKNLTQNTTGYYSTIRQAKLTKSKHIPKQLTIAELAEIYNSKPHIINNLT